MKFTTVADADTVVQRAAENVARALNATDGPAHVALAGGSLMEAFHGSLAEQPLDWERVHVWLSDERAVPPNDDDSNFKMVNRTLLDLIEIPAGNVHRPRGEAGADEAASLYEADVQAAVPGGIFDVVMCGMGPDGHTCSLFPGHPVVREDVRLVAPVHDAPKPPPDRVTFTFPLLHRSRRLVLLASGAGKADALNAVIKGPDPHVPASLLRFGRLEVIADDAAASSKSRR